MDRTKVIFPGQNLSDGYRDYPIIFLAGPMIDSPAWHEKAIDILQGYKSEKLFRIATPHEWISSPDGGRDHQIDWETEYISNAAKKGCLLFWFPLPEKKSERDYAQTSRVEIGIAMGEYKFKKFNLAVGIDPQFNGEYYIKYKLRDLGVPVLRTLEDTCRRALDLV